MSDGVQVGWRVIFDLSSPESRSVNDGIPKKYGAIVYETLNDAIKPIAKAGRGAVMMKWDLKSAFRHIPVSQRDHWLLIFEWDGKYYIDMFLPFGLRMAPRIFNLFSEALHWIFETLYGWNLSHYLDDFLAVFPPGTDIYLPTLTNLTTYFTPSVFHTTRNCAHYVQFTTFSLPTQSHMRRSKKSSVSYLIAVKSFL